MIRAGRWLNAASQAAACAGLILARTPPVHAACAEGPCQGSHTATTGGPTDVAGGCCKGGTPDGDEPGWQVEDDCPGIGRYKYWTRNLLSITHSATCVNTFTQACIPCSVGQGQAAHCSTRPVTQVQKRKHERYYSNGEFWYTHEWTASYSSACACGRHGCAQ